MLEERVESKNVILKTRKFDIMKILIILNFKKEIKDKYLNCRII